MRDSVEHGCLLSKRTLIEQQVFSGVLLGSEHLRYVGNKAERAETKALARFRVVEE